MYYAIMCEDHPDSLDKRLSARPDHLAYLESLQNQGRLLLAGPLPAVDAEDPGSAGFQGSLIVAEFADQAAAEEWSQNDPYAQAGVFSSVTIKPFKRVFPR